MTTHSALLRDGSLLKSLYPYIATDGSRLKKKICRLYECLRWRLFLSMHWVSCTKIWLFRQSVSKASRLIGTVFDGLQSRKVVTFGYLLTGQEVGIRRKIWGLKIGPALPQTILD